MIIDEIQKACRLDDLEVLRDALGQCPKSVDEPDSKLGWAPLYRTVMSGHFNSSEFLLQNGANPNVQNRLGETPLHQAADGNLLRIADLLLTYHADPNIQQNDGDTPLHLAAQKGHSKMLKLLLDHDADPNIQNFVFGKTALHYAIEKRFLHCVQLLIEWDANPLIKDRGGRNAFECADADEIKNYLSRKCEQDTEVKLFESYEDSSEINEPECERTTTKIKKKAKSIGFSSFIDEKEAMKNSLYQWLSSKKLDQCFGVLYQNGFDDLECIFEQMRSEMPLNSEVLTIIGINKPGYRYRLLAWLEEDCKKPLSNLNNKNTLAWCTNPISSPGLQLSPTIEEWLGSINLKTLHKKFYNSGFDDYDQLIFLMKSNYPITETILENEVGIDKIGYRQRVLTKLREEALICKKRTTTEKEFNGTACQSCVII